MSAHPDAALPSLADARSAHGGRGRIGPNAVTRLAEALLSLEGTAVREAVFREAGQMRHLVSPPGAMVDEEDVTRLQAALFRMFPGDRAREIAREAGRLTGLYLLANRIPKPAQAVLRFLPFRLAVRILLRAIGGHAWTFAGSGQFRYVLGAGITLTISNSPLCRAIRSAEPVCDYYAATFETVIAGATGRGVTVRETACVAAGAPECVFAVLRTTR